MMAARDDAGGGTGPPPERATPLCVPQVCTDERRNGGCRVSGPQRTAPEDGKGPGGGTREALHGGVPDDCSSSRGAQGETAATSC